MADASGILLNISICEQNNKERFRTLQKDGGQASRNDPYLLEVSFFYECTKILEYLTEVETEAGAEADTEFFLVLLPGQAQEAEAKVFGVVSPERAECQV